MEENKTAHVEEKRKRRKKDVSKSKRIEGRETLQFVRGRDDGLRESKITAAWLEL
jgi:hypothetical protein